MKFTTIMQLEELNFVSWKAQVDAAQGHDYLHAGWKNLLGSLACQAGGALASGGNWFLRIAGVLGGELKYALNRHEACCSYEARWAAAKNFAKNSDAWGEFLLQNQNRFGGYDIVESRVEEHPRCACGGPHYRFRLLLRPGWRAYADRCIICLEELAACCKKIHAPVTPMPAPVAQDWLLPFRKGEWGVGKGALTAMLDYGIDRRRLARVLASAGFELPPYETFSEFRSNQPQASQSNRADSDETILCDLLIGVAKVKSEQTATLLRSFADDERTAVRTLAGKLLSQTDAL